MKTVIRIVKRGRTESSQRPQSEPETKQPSDREIAITIKSWITDREQRRRSAERINWDMLSKFAQ